MGSLRISRIFISPPSTRFFVNLSEPSRLSPFQAYGMKSNFKVRLLFSNTPLRY